AESSVHLGENDPNKVATTWRNPQAAEILVSVTSDYRQRSGCLGGILPRHAGMQLVGGSGPNHPLGESAFLSSRPDQESHEIALFANRAYAHIAFKVFLARGTAIVPRAGAGEADTHKVCVRHGVSFAFYFEDPDGHMIEIYWPTGVLETYR